MAWTLEVIKDLADIGLGVRYKGKPKLLDLGDTELKIVIGKGKDGILKIKDGNEGLIKGQIAEKLGKDSPSPLFEAIKQLAMQYFRSRIADPNIVETAARQYLNEMKLKEMKLSKGVVAQYGSRFFKQPVETENIGPYLQDFIEKHFTFGTLLEKSIKDLREQLLWTGRDNVEKQLLKLKEDAEKGNVTNYNDESKLLQNKLGWINVIIEKLDSLEKTGGIKRIVLSDWLVDLINNEKKFDVAVENDIDYLLGRVDQEQLEDGPQEAENQIRKFIIYQFIGWYNQFVEDPFITGLKNAGFTVIKENGCNDAISRYNSEDAKKERRSIPFNPGTVYILGGVLTRYLKEEAQKKTFTNFINRSDDYTQAQKSIRDYYQPKINEAEKNYNSVLQNKSQAGGGWEEMPNIIDNYPQFIEEREKLEKARKKKLDDEKKYQKMALYYLGAINNVFTDRGLFEAGNKENRMVLVGPTGSNPTVTVITKEDDTFSSECFQYAKTEEPEFQENLVKNSTKTETTVKLQEGTALSRLVAPLESDEKPVTTQPVVSESEVSESVPKRPTRWDRFKKLLRLRRRGGRRTRRRKHKRKHSRRKHSRRKHSTRKHSTRRRKHKHSTRRRRQKHKRKTRKQRSRR